MQNDFLDYLNTLDNSSGEVETWDMFKSKMLDLGFDTTSNSVIVSESTKRDGIVCKENFRNNWLQEYFDKKYMEEDLMVSHCTQFGCPIVLDSDNKADSRRWGSEQMIDGYRQAGMKRVVSIPMHTERGKLGGIVTLGTNIMSTKEFDQIISNDFAALYGIVVASYVKLQPDLKKRAANGTTNITPRQNEVLALLAQGLSNKLIATKLNISEATVSFHLREIRIKFNCLTNREILPIVYKVGLI